jgi:hypothetical protein
MALRGVCAPLTTAGRCDIPDVPAAGFADGFGGQRSRAPKNFVPHPPAGAFIRILDEPRSIPTIRPTKFDPIMRLACTRLPALLILLLAGPASRAQMDDFRSTPLFDQFTLTLGPGSRTEALGPIYSKEEKPGRKQIVIAPLYSKTEYTDVGSREIDFLYPVLTYDQYGKEYRFQIIQLFSIMGGEKQGGDMVRRFYIFPLYFQQRSPDTNLNYTALVPFYGTIKNKLMRDEVSFIMFPIYGRSRKRDVVTDNYFFPFYHVRHGDGLKGWQLWPFVGEEHKEPTVRTNRFEGVDLIPGHDQHFYMWPFWFNDRMGLGTSNEIHYKASLPFYAQERSPQRDFTSVLMLFNKVDDRNMKYREWDFPWPFFSIARGEGKKVTRFFPIYNQGWKEGMETCSYVWPAYHRRHFWSDSIDIDRTACFFWVYSSKVERNKETGGIYKRVDCWPLLTHTRRPNGEERLQILSLLEPILPESKSLERDWSPIWSLWRSEKNRDTGASSQSLLWNFYRHKTTLETRHTSLLFGLFQWNKTPEGSGGRIFFIPFGRQPSAVSPAKTPPVSPSKPESHKPEQGQP